MTSPERRRFHRIATDKPASLSVAGTEFQCQVVDISLHGILLDCASAIAVSAIGEPASARVQFDGADFGIGLEGRVIHVDGRHVGIESRQMDLESAARLRRLVELNLADEALLERELGELIAAQAD